MPLLPEVIDIAAVEINPAVFFCPLRHPEGGQHGAGGSPQGFVGGIGNIRFYLVKDGLRDSRSDPSGNRTLRAQPPVHQRNPHFS